MKMRTGLDALPGTDKYIESFSNCNLKNSSIETSGSSKI